MLHIAYALMVLASLPGHVVHRAPKPFWYHNVPSCPLHYSVWVDQKTGKTRCVKEVTHEQVQ